jgi:tryptophan synthase alpha chain
MNRIDKKLQLRVSGKKILSPYITAGDPSPQETVALMHALVAGGADIIELGIPFSDPMAEGPVIQAAMERALAYQVNCSQVLAMVIEFRKMNKDTPIILMGYLNPIEQYGYERFAKDASIAGVDGMILVDLPPEESQEIVKYFRDNNLYLIFLCSPTTTDKRMALINELGKGYLYYVSIKGVTGADTLNIDTVKNEYSTRKKQASLPIFVGFGIKTAETAAKIAEFADGVVVGAALINCINEAYNNKNSIEAAAEKLIRSLRNAMDKNNH